MSELIYETTDFDPEFKSTVKRRWFDSTTQEYQESTTEVLGNPKATRSVSEGVVATLYNVRPPYTILIEDSNKGTKTLREYSEASDIFGEFSGLFVDYLHDQMYVGIDRRIDSGYVTNINSFESLSIEDQFMWREAYQAATRTVAAIVCFNGETSGIDYNPPEYDSDGEFVFSYTKFFTFQNEIQGSITGEVMPDQAVVLDIVEELSADYFLYGRPCQHWKDDTLEDLISQESIDNIDFMVMGAKEATTSLNVFLDLFEEAMDAIENNWQVIDQIAKKLIKQEGLDSRKIHSIVETA